MNGTDYCNGINTQIDEHFREQNNGFDSDVFCDERIDEGVIALNWHTSLDNYITTEYVKDVALFVFATFSDVRCILTPCGDYERKVV